MIVRSNGKNYVIASGEAMDDLRDRQGRVPYEGAWSGPAKPEKVEKYTQECSYQVRDSLESKQ